MGITTTKAEYQKEYRERNKEKVRAYYRNNKEKLLEYQKAYYERNKEKIKGYYQIHKEKYREYNRRRVDNLKAQGLCTQCKKTKEQDRLNLNWCNDCKNKYSRMARERRQPK